MVDLKRKMNMKGLVKFPAAAAFLGLFVFCGCVYFNTYYLAKKSYSKAEQSQKKSGRETADGAAFAEYQNAIKWASRVLTFHPKSGWVDDALFLIGRSYYNMGEHLKAQVKFEELLNGFPDSKLVPEGRIYLARSILKSGRPEAARDFAQKSIDEVKSKEIKGELAFVAAESHYALGDYPGAVAAYEKVLTYPVKKGTKANLFSRLGSAYFQQEKFAEAYQQFLEVRKHSPSAELLYNSSLAAADCGFKIGKSSEGIALVSKLAKDSRFATSAGELHLKVAQGYAAQDSLEKALKLLSWMTDFYKLQKVSGQAYLETGKIYQEKLGDLKKAKEYYELASKENPTPQVMQEALARSGEIARFESFQHELALAPPDSATPADTGKTRPPIKKLPSATRSDSAKLAESWFLLAEVYRLSLKKPDSALWAYETIFEKFSNTPVAPKAMLAWGYLKETVFGDSAGAFLMYRQLLSAHPHSDFAREALARLHLLGTPADTGYAEAVFREAERLMEDGQINSAKAVLGQIPERFPLSDYAPKALLTLAFLYEAYGDAGADSAAFLAYQNVMRKYPESEYARKAKEKVGLLPPETKKKDSLAVQMPAVALSDSARKADSVKQAALDTLKQYDRFRSELAPPVKPGKNGGFVYPASEYDSRIRTKLVFRVLLDFEGRVQRAELQNPTGRDAIDQEATRAVQQTEFDMNRVDPGKINTFFIYELEVVPPQADPNAPELPR